jgi:PST family polysaccharide transporter
MRGLALDTVVLFAERGVRLLCGALVATFLARTLGPDVYGLYSYALSLTVLFAWLGQAGLEPILVRDLVTRAEALPMLSAAFALRLLGAVCALGLATLTAALSATDELAVTWLVGLMSLSGLLQASYVFDAWLQSRQAFRASALAKTLALLCASLARVIAALSEQPLLGLALVTVGESALTGWLLWIAARGQGARRVFAAFDRGELSTLWRAARPMLLSSFAIVIYSRADVVLLGQLASRAEVGQYSAASTLSEAFYVVPVALMQAATPRLSELHRRDDRLFREACMRLVRYCSLAGLGIALVVSVLADPIVSLVYGPKFSGSSQMLAVHVWSTWMVFVSVASEPWYIHRQLRHRFVRKTLIAAGLNVALNAALIPRYGGVGAALATLCSYAASAFGCNVLWRDTRDLFWLQLRAMIPFAPAPEHDHEIRLPRA